MKAVILAEKADHRAEDYAGTILATHHGAWRQKLVASYLYWQRTAAGLRAEIVH